LKTLSASLYIEKSFLLNKLTPDALFCLIDIFVDTKSLAQQGHLMPLLLEVLFCVVAELSVIDEGIIELSLWVIPVLEKKSSIVDEALFVLVFQEALIVPNFHELMPIGFLFVRKDCRAPRCTELLLY
jgi:hypothetical protein